MLDEFSTTKIDEKKDAPTASGPGRPDTQNLISLPDDAIPDDFSKQLQSEMAALMGGMEETPEMQQQIEAMMKELGTVVDPLSHLGQQAADKTNETASNQGPSSTEEESFQETIRKTMERMQASGERATAAATSDNSDDILAQMLKNMQGGDSEGAGGEEDFSKMLMGMMEQLTNRAILYEPMKELHDKFPGWMSKNKESTKPEDLHRYEEQQSLVAQIVGRFERKEYSDDNAVDREFIVERMQKVQRNAFSYHITIH